MRSFRCRGNAPAAVAAWAVASAVCLAVGLAGCSGAPATPDAPRTVGQRVHTWGQGQGAELADLQQLAPPADVVLIADQSARDRLRTASTIDQTTIAATDLEANILVLGGYPNCQASSHLEFDRAKRTLTFAVTRDEKVNCVWAPYTVDAFEVARSDLGGLDPGELTVRRLGAT